MYTDFLLELKSGQSRDPQALLWCQGQEERVLRACLSVHLPQHQSLLDRQFSTSDQSTPFAWLRLWVPPSSPCEVGQGSWVPPLPDSGGWPSRSRL